MNTPPLDVTDMAGRLAWALLLGSAVGFERQWHQKMAGLKTNALVALGAAGFVCFGLWQPAGIAASLVLGANLALRPVANRLNSRVQAGNEVESHYTLIVQCE